MKKIRIDKLGRIVIPQSIRNELCITTDTPLQIYKDGDKISIVPLNKSCALCGEIIAHDKDIRLCDACINKVREQ